MGKGCTSSVRVTICWDWGHSHVYDHPPGDSRIAWRTLAVTLIGVLLGIALSPPECYWCEVLVVGVRDCTVVGGGATLLKVHSTPVREFSGGYGPLP